MHFLFGILIVLAIVYFAIISPEFRLAVFIVIGIPLVILVIFLMNH